MQKNSFWLINSLVVMLFSSPLFAALPWEKQQTAIMEEIGRDIVSGMDDYHGIHEYHPSFRLTFPSFGRVAPPVNQSDKALKQKIRVAILPFEQKNIPVNKNVADNLNTILITTILKRGGTRYEVVARDSLKNIIQDMDQTGALDNGFNPVNTLLENAQNVDILIMGNISLDGEKTLISYKAVKMDGKEVASTKPKEIQLKQAVENIDAATLSLQQAVDDIARQLAKQAPEMKELHLDGIRFANSGAQPDAGRYLLEKISYALSSHYSNFITGKSLKIRDSKLTLKMPANTRGLDVKEAKQKTVVWQPTNEYTYTLMGSYWIIGDSVEIRAELKSYAGKRYTAMVRARKETFSGMALRPSQDVTPLRTQDNMGPIRLTLSTDKGNDPTYKLGEKMNMLIRLSHEAWVYCFYTQANGDTIQIFPNPHFWSLYNEPKLEAKKLYAIPGETTFPFDLVVQPPLGVELLKCFATLDDVTEKLPLALRGHSLEPLPEKNKGVFLSHIFQNLEHTSVTEASVVVTVVE